MQELRKYCFQESFLGNLVEKEFNNQDNHKNNRRTGGEY